MAVTQQLPLQLHWIFPSQAGSAVARSVAGLVTRADHLVLLLEGSDSLLDSWYQALHSQILHTVRTYTNSSSVKWDARFNFILLWWAGVVKWTEKKVYYCVSTYQCIQRCPETPACWRWVLPWLEYWCPCSKGTWLVEKPLWYEPVEGQNRSVFMNQCHGRVGISSISCAFDQHPAHRGQHLNVPQQCSVEYLWS